MLVFGWCSVHGNPYEEKSCHWAIQKMYLHLSPSTHLVSTEQTGNKWGCVSWPSRAHRPASLHNECSCGRFSWRRCRHCTCDSTLPKWHAVGQVPKVRPASKTASPLRKAQKHGEAMNFVNFAEHLEIAKGPSINGYPVSKWPWNEEDRAIFAAAWFIRPREPLHSPATAESGNYGHRRTLEQPKHGLAQRGAVKVWLKWLHSSWTSISRFRFRWSRRSKCTSIFPSAFRSG